MPCPRSVLAHPFVVKQAAYASAYSTSMSLAPRISHRTGALQSHKDNIKHLYPASPLWGLGDAFRLFCALVKAKCCRKHGQAALPASSLPTQHRSPDCRQHTPQVISLCPPCQPQFVFLMPRGCEWGGDAAEAIPPCSEGWPLLLGALPLLLTWGVGHASAHLSVKLQRRLQVIWMVHNAPQQARLSVINGS